MVEYITQPNSPERAQIDLEDIEMAQQAPAPAAAPGAGAKRGKWNKFGYTKYGIPRKRPYRPRRRFGGRWGGGGRGGRFPRVSYGVAGPRGAFTSFSGWGKYTKNPRQWYLDDDFGSRWGGRIGSMFGQQQVGSLLGTAAQYGLRAMGLGEYTIKSNSLMDKIDWSMSPPKVVNSSMAEGTVVSHREYIGELKTGAFSPGSNSTAFNLQAFSINIGNSTLFPFGAALASRYQEWVPNGIIVELKSLASDYAAQLSMGAMMVSTDYNCLGPHPKSKLEMENMEYSVSCKPSDNILHPVECARENTTLTHLYVVTDNDHQGGDPRFANLGNLYIASQGCPVENTIIAEIWISYEVILFKPILTSLSLNNLTYMAWYSICTLPGNLYGVPHSTFTMHPGSTLIVPQATGDIFYLPSRNVDKFYSFQADLYQQEGSTWNNNIGLVFVNMQGCVEVPLAVEGNETKYWNTAIDISVEVSSMDGTTGIGKHYTFQGYIKVFGSTNTNNVPPQFRLTPGPGWASPNIPPFRLSVILREMPQDLFPDFL